MELGMIGLGRMGGNMTVRLLQKGHRVVVYDRSEESVNACVSEGAAGSTSLEDLVSQLSAPRAVWVMVPAGDPTEQTINAVAELLSPGDSIIDGGNSNYHETQRRAAAVAEKGITMLDCGTSGGIWGLTEGGLKRTGRDPRVQPKVTLYDPELTVTLPPAVAGPSGMNAIAHCVEALYAPNANPIMSLLAEEGVRALAESLPRVVAAPGDLENHGNALYGAWLAGLVLGSVGMALHHKLCHVLGGTFNTPHAETHALILPYAGAYNLVAAPDAKRRLASALGTAQVACALRELSLAVGAPATLGDLGLSTSDLETAADLATRAPYYNPREVTREGVHQLLLDAFHGVMPR